MLLAEYDYQTDIEVQREEAFEQGIEQGIEQGELQQKLATICKMKAKGYDIQIIMDLVSATEEEIKMAENFHK